MDEFYTTQTVGANTRRNIRSLSSSELPVVAVSHPLLRVSIAFFGGAQFAYADGSVHFVSENIDHNATTHNQWANQTKVLGTYQRLANRHDGLTVNSDL